MTCELKTFELALNMLKFNLEGSLNLKGLLSSFKEPSSQKIIMEREVLQGGGGERAGSRQFDFLCRNFSRPKA
jgi:hypothetical protein